MHSIISHLVSSLIVIDGPFFSLFLNFIGFFFFYFNKEIVFFLLGIKKRKKQAHNNYTIAGLLSYYVFVFTSTINNQISTYTGDMSSDAFSHLPLLK